MGVGKMKKAQKVVHQVTGTQIVFCYGAKTYTQYIKNNFGLDEHISKSGVSTEIINEKENKYAIVIGIRKHKNIYSLKGLLIHELSHTVSQLMQQYGFNCDEVRSTTLQWLYQKFVPALDEILLKESIKRDKKAHKRAKDEKNSK